MKSTTKFGFAAWIVLAGITHANAQRKSLDVGLEAGPYFTAVNQPIVGSGYVGGEFEYFVSDRFSLASNLMLAKYYFQKYELDYFSQWNGRPASYKAPSRPNIESFSSSGCSFR